MVANIEAWLKFVRQKLDVRLRQMKQICTARILSGHKTRTLTCLPSMVLCI